MDCLGVDELVSEFERNPADRELLSDARKFVAEKFYSSHPETVATLRLRKGWSQKDLADAIGTSQPYIARLEGRRVDPRYSTLKRIAVALGADLPVVVAAIEHNSSADE